MTRRRRLGMGMSAVFGAALACAAHASPRVMSLDGCADQFVMALAPRSSIVGVSHRADDPDSWLKERAVGLPVRRASFEAVWAARPQVVVRYWGGDARLTQALRARGVEVVEVEEATDFGGVRGNVERVARALGRERQGRTLLAEMEANLAASAGAWDGRRALYVTPGAYTAGSGTLIDAILRAAGLRNAVTGPGFQPAPLEELVLSPPGAWVRGFFDMARFARWQLGRHAALERAARGRTIASLPGAVLGCPAWFAAEGAAALARAAPPEAARP